MAPPNTIPSVPAVYHTVPALVDWVELWRQARRDPEHHTPPDRSTRSRKLCLPGRNRPCTCRAMSMTGPSYTCEASS